MERAAVSSDSAHVRAVAVEAEGRFEESPDFSAFHSAFGNLLLLSHESGLNPMLVLSKQIHHLLINWI